MTTVRETFDKSTTAFNAHDIGGFTDLIAEDAEYRAPGGMTGAGRQACAEFFAGWLAAFPDAHVTVRDLYVCNDVAVEEGTFAGTHEGVLRTPDGDIQPTGRRVAIDYMMAIRFRDDKQTAFHLSYDRLDMLEQLGLASA